MAKRDPFQPADEEARTLARHLMQSATYAALAVLQDQHPVVTRIAITTALDGGPMTLISDLSHHTVALRINPDCSLLVGEPGSKGDPLTDPRLTLQATARFVPQDSSQHAVLRARYLQQRPKAQLYIDFSDFHLVRFDIRSALLNGGFGRAYKMTANDL